jgi:hypothetical protein
VHGELSRTRRIPAAPCPSALPRCPAN